LQVKGLRLRIVHVHSKNGFGEAIRMPSTFSSLAGLSHIFFKIVMAVRESISIVDLPSALLWSN
jgi:hypothetical protein